MLSGMIVGAVVVVAALMLFALGGHIRKGQKHFIGFSLLGLAIAGSVVAVVFYFEPGEPTGPRQQNRAFASGLSLAELDTVTAALRAPVTLPPTSATKSAQVGSVQSLLDGLRQKLEADPDNASGWALLAQSYAFTGDMEFAEAALAHAVALGLDESEVRQRVASARRDPHTNVAMTN